jgi:uncharacterized protein YqjF (DUF2071 family)
MTEHDSIDRLTPMLEPDATPLMTQSWHHLLFLHWKVPAAELQALLPAGLTVDTFDGNAYIGLVPFTVDHLHATMAPPIPGLSAFHEINVRTYVHRQGADPGVWFFSLDASSGPAVMAARLLYKLSYYRAEIAMSVSDQTFPQIGFDARRSDERSPSPAYAHLRYRGAEGPVATPAAGTLDAFLLDRYVLYAESEHQLYRCRIHHAPARAQDVEVEQLDETLTWAAGVKRDGGAPVRHYVRSIDEVKVYAPERV